ncbi:MAG: hypothetical protein R3C97_07460 [Geminicoccaceae bacterium]
MLALSGERDDVVFRVTRGVTRPVWSPGLERTMHLYEKARELALSLGFDISHESAGGGSDGNFTGALGIATLDLGVRGAGLHTLDEHIDGESLVERGKLMAGLLLTLE